MFLENGKREIVSGYIIDISISAGQIYETRLQRIHAMKVYFIHLVVESLCEVVAERAKKIHNYENCDWYLAPMVREIEFILYFFHCYKNKVEERSSQKLNKFICIKFQLLNVELYLIAHCSWNGRRGERCTCNTFEVLFMKLTEHKNGSDRYFLHYMFKLKPKYLREWSVKLLRLLSIMRVGYRWRQKRNISVFHVWWNKAYEFKTTSKHHTERI